MVTQFKWSGFNWRSSQPWGVIHPDKPIQHYDADAVKVYDDKLKLFTFKKEKFFRIDDDLIKSPIAVGLVCSKETFRYGTFEIKAMLPKQQNLWPAFWLTAVDAWPPEIDIMEGYTNNKGSYFDFNLKTPMSFWNIETNVHYKEEGDNKSIGPKNGFVGFFNPAVREITFTLHWTEKYIAIMYDGVLVRYVDDPIIMRNINSSKYNVIINNGVKDNIDLNENCDSEFVIHYFKYNPL